MIIDQSYFENFHLKNWRLNNSPVFADMQETDIIVPPYIPNKIQFNPVESYSYDELAESISYYYKQKNCNIFFDSSPEGLNISFIKPMNEVVKKLVFDHNVPVEKITYISGALPIQRNIVEYYDYCKRNNLIPLKIILTNSWEIHGADNGRELKDRVLPYIGNIKNKKFISMNGVPRIHRVYCAMLLLEKNLLNHSHYSFLLEKNYNLTDAIKFGKIYFPGLTSRIANQIVKHQNKFPLVLTKKPNLHPTQGQFVYDKDIELMNDVYFNLIQETNFVGTEDTEGFNTRRSVLVSEKTWRSMIFKLPFINLNHPYCMAGLREYGYKTFDPFFNESYDEIEDDTARLLAVVREIERLCKLSDKEWMSIQRALNDIVEYNFEKLFSAKPFIIKSYP